MALSITDELILKVHSGPDGQVWFLDGDRLPENSGLPVTEYVARHQTIARADKVRMMGLPGNNTLLAMALFARKLHGDLDSLEVCSPLACDTGARREKPESVLFDLRKWGGRPSCGGWHEFTHLDYPTYNIAFLLGYSGDTGITEQMLRLLRDHPVWPAISAVPHLSCLNLCRLLASILDPRFFIDPADPDRLSKLEAYLGLDPKIAICEGRIESPTHQHMRYRNVLSCWKNDDPGRDVALDSPELFIWRAFYEAGGGWKGDLRASQRFVYYLRHTWLDALYPEKPWVEPLFVPEHFFDAPTARWYRGRLKRKS